METPPVKTARINASTNWAIRIQKCDQLQRCVCDQSIKTAWVKRNRRVCFEHTTHKASLSCDERAVCHRGSAIELTWA